MPVHSGWGAVSNQATYGEEEASESHALCTPANQAHAGSFNDWESPIPLRRIDEDDDFVRSVVLPPGLVEYKFVVDDVWCHSPRDAIKVDESTSSINNRKVVETNSRVTWRSTGTESEVYMTGSFLAWSEVVPLKRKDNGFFEADCCFPVCYSDATILVASLGSSTRQTRVPTNQLAVNSHWWQIAEFTPEFHILVQQ
jgi:hypothetical protein